MASALLIVDVQNDFTEGGALGVEHGDEVAASITRYLAAHAGEYDLVVASRDWHDADSTNGGHFAGVVKNGHFVAGQPDLVTTWPVHCVAETPGAEYWPEGAGFWPGAVYWPEGAGFWPGAAYWPEAGG